MRPSVRVSWCASDLARLCVVRLASLGFAPLCCAALLSFRVTRARDRTRRRPAWQRREPARAHTRAPERTRNRTHSADEHGWMDSERAMDASWGGGVTPTTGGDEPRQRGATHACALLSAHGRVGRWLGSRCAVCVTRVYVCVCVSCVCASSMTARVCGLEQGRAGAARALCCAETNRPRSWPQTTAQAGHGHQTKAHTAKRTGTCKRRVEQHAQPRSAYRGRSQLAKDHFRKSPLLPPTMTLTRPRRTI